jgi:hypothetical protein
LFCCAAFPETEAALRIIVDPIDGTAAQRSELPFEEFNEQIFSYTIDSADRVAFLFTTAARVSVAERSQASTTPSRITSCNFWSNGSRVASTFIGSSHRLFRKERD